MTLACVLCPRPWSVSKSGTGFELWWATRGRDSWVSRTGPDGLSRGVLPEQCLPPRPGGWRESRGVALGAASCMRCVRELTARGKPVIARSSGSAVGVLNHVSHWMHSGQ